MKRLALIAFAGVALAQADIIPMLIGSGGVNCGIQSSTWGCDYSYIATLHDDATLTGDQSPHAEYFTLYDFNGYIDGSATPPNADWTVSAQPLGITPSHINMAAEDDPTVNVTFTYVGNTDVAGGSDLGTFTLRSIYGPGVTPSHFSSQATHAIYSVTSPAWVQNVGQVDVPTPFRGDEHGAVPEPISMTLIGSGLAGLGLFRRFRRQ